MTDRNGDFAYWLIQKVSHMTPAEVIRFCELLTPEQVKNETGCVVTQEQIRICIDTYILMPKPKYHGSTMVKGDDT